MKALSEAKKEKVRRRLPVLVIGFLLVLFIGGAVGGGIYILHISGVEAPYEPEASFGDFPETAQETSFFFDEAMRRLLTETSRVEVRKLVSFNSDTQPFIFTPADDLSSMIASLLLEQGKAADSYASLFPERICDYPDDTGAFLEGMSLQENELRNVQCDLTYYQCGCEEINEDTAPEVCPKCRRTASFEERLKDDAVITAELDPDGAFYKNWFSETDADAFIAFLNENGAEMMEADSAEITYSSPFVRIEIGRTDGILKKISISAIADIYADLSFTEGKKREIKISLTETQEYRVTLPSVSLVRFKGDESEALGSTFYIDRSTQMQFGAHVVPQSAADSLRWESSDENIVKVDQLGYITSQKTDGLADVTASIEFEGKTYADTVKVIVGVRVSEVRLNRYSLTLSPGDTYRLKANVKPKKASDRSVQWFSEDPEIASVDQEGNVTATGIGKTVVYALTNDGYYKAVCKTEVRKK